MISKALFKRDFKISIKLWLVITAIMEQFQHGYAVCRDARHDSDSLLRRHDCI